MKKLKLHEGKMRNIRFDKNLFANTESELEEINNQIYNKEYKAKIIEAGNIGMYIFHSEPVDVVLKNGAIFTIWDDESECDNYSDNCHSLECENCKIGNEKITLHMERFSNKGFYFYEIDEIPAKEKLIIIDLAEFIDRIDNENSITETNNLTEEELNFLLT